MKGAFVHRLVENSESRNGHRIPVLKSDIGKLGSLPQMSFLSWDEIMQTERNFQESAPCAQRFFLWLNRSF
jgi:hypothetical protein